MADAKVTITIGAKDEASKEIKKVKLNLKELGSQLTDVGTKITAAFTLPIAGAFAMAVSQSQELQAALQPIKDEFAGIAAEFGNALVPVVKELTPMLLDVAKSLKDIVKAFADMPTPVKDVIVGVAAFVAAIGPLVVIVGQVVSTIGTLQTLLPVLATAFGAISLPVLGLVAAIGALIAVIAIWGDEALNTFKQIAGLYVWSATGKIPDWALDTVKDSGSKDTAGSAVDIGNLQKTINTAITSMPVPTGTNQPAMGAPGNAGNLTVNIYGDEARFRRILDDWARAKGLG